MPTLAEALAAFALRSYAAGLLDAIFRQGRRAFVKLDRLRLWRMRRSRLFRNRGRGVFRTQRRPKVLTASPDSCIVSKGTDVRRTA
jgi:hypothetical protein